MKIIYVDAFFALLILLQGNAKQYSFDCERVAWFMGLKWEERDVRLNYVKFAILSAQQHAPMLQPVLILLHPDKPSKKSTAWMDWFHRNNVIVCNSTEDTLMISELIKYGNGNKMIRETKRPKSKYPIFYRMDIDQYFQKCAAGLPDVNQQYALYTDIDVGIVNNINSCNLPKPDVLSMGAEHQVSKIVNTGVLVVNLQKYASYKNEFAEFLRDKWDKYNNDQTMIDVFFHFKKNKVQFLPNEFNYKMYWEGLELKEEPVILHAHGIKFETKCYTCLSMVSSKEEAKETCPKCELALWFMYGNPQNLYQSVLDYYNKLVFQNPPYYNASAGEMVVY